MTSQAEIALALAIEMLRKSGVKEWLEVAPDEDTPTVRELIASAAIEMAALIWLNREWIPPGTNYMALPDYFRISTGTEITFKSSGGSAAITMTSVANVAGRQSVKADFGATRARKYKVYAEVELAATPTAGNTIDLYANPSGSATAGTDNMANASGTDAAYAGYSSNLTASLPQLEYIGSLVCTAQATATVQKGFVGIFEPTQQYASLIVVNNSGAAFHSSATNVVFRFVPIVDEVDDT